MTEPVIEGPLGRPPFETPTIAKAVSNFVQAKFSSNARVGAAGALISGSGRGERATYS